VTKDLALRLGLLAKDRSEGRLTLQAYRKLRAPLLDKLAPNPEDDSDAWLVTRPRSPPRAANAEHMMGARPDEASLNLAIPLRRSRALMWVCALAIVVALIALSTGLLE